MIRQIMRSVQMLTTVQESTVLSYHCAAAVSGSVLVVSSIALCFRSIVALHIFRLKLCSVTYIVQCSGCTVFTMHQLAETNKGCEHLSVREFM